MEQVAGSMEVAGPLLVVWIRTRHWKEDGEPQTKCFASFLSTVVGGGDNVLSLGNHTLIAWVLCNEYEYLPFKVLHYADTTTHRSHTYKVLARINMRSTPIAIVASGCCSKPTPAIAMLGVISTCVCVCVCPP